MSGRASPTDPLVLSHPDYDPTVHELIAALVAVNAQPAFDSMSWDGSRRYQGGTALAEAHVADAMRLVTVIVRGEHFSDGTLAQAVADGSLFAATERILTELDEPEAQA